MMMYNIIRTLQWCQDREECDEDTMPKMEHSDHNYLGFTHISQKELDNICLLVNPILKHLNFSFVLTNSMGEIIPWHG